MDHLYFISGFGADERVFSKFISKGNEVHFIQWLIPVKKEPLIDYAKRMAAYIHHKDPVLIGLSFGGIMCVEISKIFPVKAVILISSMKSFEEMPFWMRFAGATMLHRILPLRSFKLIESLENYNLGIETFEEKKMMAAYRKNIDQQYTNWAINIILTWKNTWKPEKLFHIHGRKDRLLPIRNIKADYVIQTGGHMMILNRAKEINEAVNKILSAI